MKKLTYKEIFEKFAARGWQLLEEEYRGSLIPMEAICPNNCRTKISWNNLQKGQSCGLCSITCKKTIEEIKKEFENQNCTLLEKEYVNNCALMKYTCNCGKLSKISYKNFAAGHRCHKKKISINPLIDFDLNIAVRNGNSVLQIIDPVKAQNKNYVRKMFENIKNSGKTPLLVYPHEWKNRREQWSAHAAALDNSISRKIFARKCEIKEVDKSTVREFCDLYHIQGGNNLMKIGFGLFQNDELLGVMSLGRHHRQFDVLLLDRLCFKHNIHITGGATRLFKYCLNWAKEKQYTEIVSFSDNRYSLGGIYEKLGFLKEKELGNDYFYLNQKDQLEHFSKQSQKNDNTKCPETMTEYEWAVERGLMRVWDAGKIRWVCKI